MGAADVNVGHTLNMLGRTHERQEQYEKAEASFRQCVEILERGGDPQCAVALRDVARMLHLQGRGAESELVLKRAITILAHSGRAEHLDMAATLENHVDILRETARHHEAESVVARARAIRAKHELSEN